MNAVTGAAGAGHFDEEALTRGVASVRHPLTRALLVLTFTTGLVDAVSYLRLGRVFTANMTGNVVLLGFGVAGGQGLPVLAPVLSLIAFLVGSLLAGLLVKRSGSHLATLAGRALALEFVLLGVASVVAAAAYVRPGDTAAYVLIVLLACAMGFRSIVVRRHGVPDLSTVVLTMTLGALAAQSSLAGGSGAGSVRRLSAVLAMFAGALIGALLVRTSVAVTLALAAILALVTWLLYVPAARRLGGRSARQ